MFTQIVDPVGNLGLTCIVALIPVVFLLMLLAVFRVSAWLAVLLGSILTFVLAVWVWKMPLDTGIKMCIRDRLYAFVIARLDRRDLVWINVTTNPTAEWIARQLTEAFPWNEAPRYLIRDRDRIYGAVVIRRMRAMGIRDKPTAPASPWQNGFAERLIGSIRRECVDHFIVLGEAHLRRILRAYAGYYNDIRTHWSLDKDAPVSRPIQPIGSIKSHSILGGLHHHYVRV